MIITPTFNIIVDGVEVLLKYMKILIVLKFLQKDMILWYHNYLQYPGCTILDERSNGYNVIVRHAYLHTTYKSMCMYVSYATQVILNISSTVYYSMIKRNQSFPGKHYSIILLECTKLNVDYICVAMIDSEVSDLKWKKFQHQKSSLRRKSE